MAANDATGAGAEPPGPATAGLSKEEYEKRRLEEHGMGTLVVIYRTVVVLGCSIALIIWNGGDDKKVLAGFLAAGLCVLLCFWSQYINQYLLDPPMPFDPSFAVLLVSLMLAVVALCAGSAAVMCVDVLLVAAFFGWCVANLARRSPAQTSDSSLIEEQDTGDQAGDKAPAKQGGVKVETRGPPLLPKLPSIRPNRLSSSD